MLHVRRSISLIIAVAGLSLAAMPAFAAGADAAAKYIQGVGDQALAVIANKSLNKDQKQKKLEIVFSTNVDFPWVARFVMGQYWRQASAEQKAQYVKAYQKFEIHHYTSRFSDYTSGAFKVTSSRDDGGDEFTVDMQMKGDDANSEPVLVEYRVRREGAGFRIFDINVEGVSMITTQRSEFASVLGNNGIDYLINQLQTKSGTEAADAAN